MSAGREVVAASAGPRFRFAPTPSRELHVGNALAALVDWAMARAAGGAFVLRIEDIDRARCKPAFEEAVFRDLAWLGLDWDEGPDVGGPFGPYRQSERFDLYDAHLAALAAAGFTYACVCSRADIRAAQSAPHLGPRAAIAGLDGGELPYPGTCRGRALALPADRGGVRLDLAALAAHGIDPIVTWRDGSVGDQREDVRTTAGDVLLGRPGQPTYQLAVVADDRAMGVTDVVRGVDLLGSTARQLLLHAALDRVSPHGVRPPHFSLCGLDPGGSDAKVGTPPPRFHHHPLLLAGDGHKLSKRDASLALASFATSHPALLRAALGRAIGLFPAHVARASTADWVDAFAALAASGAPTLHDATWPPTAT